MLWDIAEMSCMYSTKNSLGVYSAGDLEILISNFMWKMYVDGFFTLQLLYQLCQCLLPCFLPYYVF